MCVLLERQIIGGIQKGGKLRRCHLGAVLEDPVARTCQVVSNYFQRFCAS